LLLFIVNVIASNEQKDKLMKAFEAIDLNHDGKISKNELLIGRM